MTYVDGFVLIVPKNKVNEYKKMARNGAKIWMKHGALGYYECIGDDLNPNMGGVQTLNFPRLVNIKKNETVWFSFIIYKNKAHRNKVNSKVMKDPSMNQDEWKDKPMPFDMKRFSYGGFDAIVEAKAK